MCSVFRRVESCFELLLVQRRAERERPPAQVFGDPLGQLEVGHTRLPVQPDRWNFGHRQWHALPLRGQPKADLEAVPAVNADRSHELRVVGLVGVGGVAGADARERVEAASGEARQRRFEKRASDLLTAWGVARSTSYNDAPLDESGQVVDL